jgi:hypothetical protein
MGGKDTAPPDATSDSCVIFVEPAAGVAVTHAMDDTQPGYGGAHLGALAVIILAALAIAGDLALLWGFARMLTL